MKNMKIKKKLLLSFLIVALLTAVVGIAGIVGLVNISANETKMYQYGVNSNDASEIMINIQQQRVHYRDMVIYIDDAVRRDAAIDSLNETIGEFDATFNKLSAAMLTETAKEMLQNIKTDYDAYVTYRTQLVTEVQRGDNAAAKRLLEDMKPAVNKVTETTEVLNQFALQLTKSTMDTDAVTSRFLLIFLCALALFVVILAAILGVYIANSIARPVNNIVAAADRLAVGDVDVNITVDSKDEIGTLAKSFDTMINGIQKQSRTLNLVADGDYTAPVDIRSDKDVINLSIGKMIKSGGRMVQELRDSAGQVASGADQISQGAQSLATGSSEQSANIEEFSAALAELEAATKSNAKNAQTAMDTNNNAYIVLQESTKTMKDLLRAMTAIDESSRSITKVIKVIDDIAFQTNILALNAAVEAARAGQHGKGFAVVADEVRNLASKSAAAAKETAELIAGSARNVAEGNRLVEKTNENMTTVAKSAAESTALITQVAEASLEQAKKIEEMGVGIDQISTVAQSNAATAEQSAAAAQQMSAQSFTLENIVGRYKVDVSTGMAMSPPTNSYNNAPAPYQPYQPQESTGFAVSDDKY